MSTAGFGAAVASHLRDPMRRNAYALVLGTGLTSGLGLIFWALAAHALPAATVGLGAALVSAMALLANVSTLGLRNGLVRFLPESGSASRRLILTSYALCGGTALVAASVFLLGQPLWADRLGFLRASPLGVLAFAVGTAVWVVFVLQDQVLIGLRRTVWVPVENGLCAVAKIGLLPVLAFAGGWAVFGTAVLPAAAAVLVVTALVLRHLRRSAAGTPPTTIPLTRLVRFAAADHFAALLWMGTSDLLTLLVLHVAGPEASAYYYMANTIGYSLALVTSNVGSALVAEGARYPDRTVALARQALWNSARLVVPLALVGIVVAPLVLRLLGPDYAANATTVLRLLLMAAVPQILTGIALGTARLRHDLRMIMVVYAVLAAGSVGGSWLLLPVLGITGVGLSCLVTQLVVATALLLTGRTGLWPDRGWRSMVAEVEQVPSQLRRRRSRRETVDRLAPALAACGLDRALEYSMLTSDSDTRVVALTSPDRPLVLKMATSRAASEGLERHAATVAWFRSALPPGPTSALLPDLVGEGFVAGNRVLLETRLPGEAATARAADPSVTGAAAAALKTLHDATAERGLVDETLLADWVDEPLEHLRRLRVMNGARSGLDRLQTVLRDGLRDREVVVTGVHGDFWPGNLLVCYDAGKPRVSGIVDWENGRRRGLPDVDLVHWWLAVQPVQLGAAVHRAVIGAAHAREGWRSAGLDLPNPELAAEHVLLLTWLWHVASGLTRTSADHLGRVWLARNVRPIVHLLDSGARIGPEPARAPGAGLVP